jgi:hypothetical protein
LRQRALSSTTDSTLYGADVSGYSGSTGELKIASPPTAGSPYHSFLIDSIVFSSQAIPEPSVIGLSALGVFLIATKKKLIVQS